VQAGISLHQAPLLIERGLDPTVAATAVSTFALLSAIAGFAYGFWPRRVALRFALALVGLSLGASSVLMANVHSAALAYGAASLFGLGVGGLLTMLPIAWADYFGRESWRDRGVALSVQVMRRPRAIRRAPTGPATRRLARHLCRARFSRRRGGAVRRSARKAAFALMICKWGRTP
jgi:MFS family permease